MFSIQEEQWPFDGRKDIQRLASMLYLIQRTEYTRKQTSIQDINSFQNCLSASIIENLLWIGFLKQV